MSEEESLTNPYNGWKVVVLRSLPKNWIVRVFTADGESLMLERPHLYESKDRAIEAAKTLSVWFDIPYEVVP